METPSEDPLSVGPSPGTLRALRDRAHSALAEQRKRMQQLETQLTEQLHLVAEELAAECGSDIQSAAEAATENAAEAHDTLQRERADWEAEQAVADAQMTRRMDDLAVETVELAARQERLEAKEAELALRREEVLRQVAAQDTLQLETEIERDDQKCEREKLSQSGEELQRMQDELAKEVEQFETLCSKAANQNDQQVAELQERLDAQIAEHRLQDGRASAIAAELESLQSELQSAVAKVEEQQELAATTKASHDQATVGWQKEQAALMADLDRLVNAVEESSEKLESAAELEEQAAEFEKIEKKFDLALEDLRTLREQNADLEQELARRPEQGASESSELMELRNERDGLVERIEELEKRPPLEDDGQAAEERVHLQQRFEMAVDDVRNLRKENDALVQELADSRRAAIAGKDTGGMDWESQKRRLLASLEDEGANLTEERVEAHSTIESTIRITDDVVAKKDEEIQELQQRLRDEPTPSELEENSHREAIDADEAILAERKKLAAMETEMTDQLRKAELEFSVERAKIAREQAELTDTRYELESLRGSLPEKESSPLSGRGKWFSKLGLGNNE